MNAAGGNELCPVEMAPGSGRLSRLWLPISSEMPDSRNPQEGARAVFGDVDQISVQERSPSNPMCDTGQNETIADCWRAGTFLEWLGRSDKGRASLHDLGRT